MNLSRRVNEGRLREDRGHGAAQYQSLNEHRIVPAEQWHAIIHYIYKLYKQLLLKMISIPSREPKHKRSMNHFSFGEVKVSIF